MRGITITYAYDGPEEKWRDVIGAFIDAIDGDPDVRGKFTYQVSVADDGVTRIHWGRWDNQETLQTMQSRDYFKTFAGALRELAGGPPQATPADVALKTGGW